MSETSDLQERMQKYHEEREHAAREKEKATRPLFRRMCELLLAKNVCKVVAHYDGSGDSGCINDVDYLDAEDSVIEADLSFAHPYMTLLPGFKTHKSTTNADGKWCQEEVDGTVNDFIEDFVYDRLPGGWEINEGSFGQFELDLKEKSGSGSQLVRTYTEESGDMMSGSYED